MARTGKNFSYFKYVDDNAANWCVRGEDGGAGSAVDGHAAFDGGDPVFGAVSTRRHPRYVVAQDAATFRTVKFIVYTAAAFAAIAGGDVIAVPVTGLTTTIDYTVSAKIGEKLPLAKASRHLAEA